MNRKSQSQGKSAQLKIHRARDTRNLRVNIGGVAYPFARQVVQVYKLAVGNHYLISFKFQKSLLFKDTKN